MLSNVSKDCVWMILMRIMISIISILQVKYAGNTNILRKV